MRLSTGARVALTLLVGLSVLFWGGSWWLRASTVGHHDELCERLLEAIPTLERQLNENVEAHVELVVEPVPETRGGSAYAQNSYWLTWPGPSAEGVAREAAVHVMVHFESALYGLDPRHDIRFVEIQRRPRNEEVVEFVLDLYRQEENVHLAGLN